MLSFTSLFSLLLLTAITAVGLAIGLLLTTMIPDRSAGQNRAI